MSLDLPGTERVQMPLANWRMRSGAAVCLSLLLLGGVTGPGASASAYGLPSSVHKVSAGVVTRSGTISDPVLVRRPELVSKTLRAGGSLKQLSKQLTSQNRPLNPSNEDRVREQAVEDGAQYTIESSTYPKGKLPLDQYEYITPQECETHQAQSARPEGWIKNRFSYCQRHLDWATAYSEDGKPIGTYVSGNTIIGYGERGSPQDYPNWRYAHFTLAIDSVMTTGVFDDPEARMIVSLWCGGKYVGKPPANSGSANACLATESDDKLISQWRDGGSTDFFLYSAASTPSWWNGEMLAQAVFQPRYDFRIPGLPEIQQARGEDGGMRFDSAWYLQTGKQGSVFDRSRPGLIYRLSDKTNPGRDYAGVAEVAAHIKFAQDHPEDTLPAVAGKHLPGGNRNDPLERLAKSKGPTYELRLNTNRGLSTAYCDSGMVPGYHPPATECDEYPFASTYEGAAEYIWDNLPEYMDFFSVRAVARKDNGEAGNRLYRWYDQQRILDRDRFFIDIEP